MYRVEEDHLGRAAGRERAVHEKRGLTFGLALCFCLFAGTFLFLRSPYFSVREFVVDGNLRVSREDVIARAGQTTSNIFAFDVDKASGLIESSPWVDTATVKRKFPGTIVITIKERAPVAFTPVGNDLWLVDATGRVLGKDDGAGAGLIALTGPIATVAPGQTLDPATYGWALRILSVLGPLSRQKATEISVQEQEAAIILDDGCKVLMGKERPDPETKTALLESILNDLAEGGRIAEHIDLRYDKPAVKDFVQTPKR